MTLEEWEKAVARLIGISMHYQSRMAIAVEIDIHPVLEECVLDLVADAGFCLRWLEANPCPDDGLGLLAEQLFSALWLGSRSLERLVRLRHPSPAELALIDQEIEESRAAAFGALVRLRPFLPTLEVSHGR